MQVIGAQGFLIKGIAELNFAFTNLTFAQIRTLSSVPIEHIATVGAGKAIMLIRSGIQYTFNTTGFTTPNIDLGLPSVDIITGPQLLVGNILTDIQNRFESFTDGGASGDIKEDRPIMISSAGDSAVGDGSARIFSTYLIITL